MENLNLTEWERAYNYAVSEGMLQDLPHHKRIFEMAFDWHK